MSKRNKTGGGMGTNQYRIQGRSRARRPEDVDGPDLMAQVVTTEPNIRSSDTILIKDDGTAFCQVSRAGLVTVACSIQDGSSARYRYGWHDSPSQAITATMETIERYRKQAFTDMPERDRASHLPQKWSDAWRAAPLQAAMMNYLAGDEPDDAAVPLMPERIGYWSQSVCLTVDRILNTFRPSLPDGAKRARQLRLNRVEAIIKPMPTLQGLPMILARYPDTPPELIRLIFRHQCLPQSTSMPEWSRNVLLRHPACPADVLEEAFRGDPLMRGIVVRHPQCPPYLVAMHSLSDA